MSAEPIALSAQHVERTAAMLAGAFEVDPAYRYLFPDPARRPRGLADFFARNLRTHLPHRCTHALLDPQQQPYATVTLRPPSGIHVSTLTMLRRGLLPFALAHGRGAVARLFWLKRTYDALEARAARGAPHFHVHMMAVSPDRQGRGHGAALLEQILSRELASTPGAATILSTHLPRNLVFYQRAGFAVIDEQRLQPPGDEPYTVWSMRRPA
ncbi:MAG TPA: GNAT family N-acetyltransferase [Polyangiales bacterium]|nr:GNAT family N-acetyltransferase [Polyangiales bacterium]